MARPLRFDCAGAIHHVTARGNAREAVFCEDVDRHLWNEVLGLTAERFGWLVLAYCQMGNHYHLLVETPQPNLSRGMRQLNGVYAQRFNRRHGRVGHVFQARFHAALVARDEHVLALSAYIPLNPVRGGLCTEPGNWPWSSYRTTLGLEPPGFVSVARLLSFFADTRSRARARYRAHVEAYRRDGLPDLDRSVFVGSERFAIETTRNLEPMAEIPRAHWQPVRRPLDELLESRSHASVAAAYTEHGYTMHEIADHLGVHYATVSRRIRRFETSMSDCKT